MAQNDKILVEKILEIRQQEQQMILLSQSEIFERLVVEQVLKNYDLSSEQVESGIVDGGDDGGIDAIYTFVDHELLIYDPIIFENLRISKKNPKFEVYIFQSKITPSYSETAINTISSSMSHLLDLSILPTAAHYKKMYNLKVLELISLFHKSYNDNITKNPSLSINIIYASLGDKQSIHDKVKFKANELEIKINDYISNAKSAFIFIGSAEIMEMFRKEPSSTLSLPFKKFTSTTSFKNNQGYILLASLSSYYYFISDEQGNLRRYIFDANIRDYQGKVIVNESIRETLSSNDLQEFWWLNNGVTILASSGNISGEQLTMLNPQIVNGLQTSMEIYSYFKGNKALLQGEERTLLVRVIVMNDIKSRDEIIKATNSQTAVSPASLRATDKTQRDIEDYFERKGELRYDRRKNYYINQQVPRDRIISIISLAQVVNSILLHAPDKSRSAPSSLLRTDNTYKKLFSSDYPIEMYWVCATIHIKVEAFIKKSKLLSPDEKNNVKQHVIMLLSFNLIGRNIVKPIELAKCDINKITDELILKCVTTVINVFEKIQDRKNQNLDVIAKNREGTEELIIGFTTAI